ncbi:MAG: hypothetical protein JRI96_11580 [Deltaproteobacteria bacterium]|nr:hypothetical protein [Deltaproteobacteria bacterium]
MPERLLKELTMKIMLVVCSQCGYKEKREIYDSEDAERRNLRLVPPRCSRCGSTNVKLYD